MYRWSKIAKHLPGRTDNEIKNYWRTRIQKHIKQADNHQINVNHHHQLSSEMIIEQGSTTSQVSSSNADAMETYSPPLMSYQGINYMDHQTDINNYPMALPPVAASNIDQSYNWSMEDIWSMQLLSSDS